MKNKDLKTNILRYVFYTLLTAGGFISGWLIKPDKIITEQTHIIHASDYICDSNNYYMTTAFHDFSKYKEDYKHRLKQPVTVYHYNDTVYADTIYYVEYDRSSDVNWCLMKALR